MDNEAIKQVINMMEQAQHLMFEGRYEDAATLIYSAAQDLRLLV